MGEVLAALDFASQSVLALQYKVKARRSFTMNGTRDMNEGGTAGNGDALDPAEAATLLAEARREARRQFDLQPPLLSAILGAVVFGAYVALWLSVRGQHPYTGPSGAAIAAVYSAVVVAIVVSAKVLRRATAGVDGRSRRQMKAQGVAIVAAYVAAATFQGALHYDGAGHWIVYGVWPAAAPLVIVGATVAGIASGNEDWVMFGTGLAAVATGVAASFAGPAGAWAVAGAGLFVLIVARSVALAWRRDA
jgi:hypothetical protein